MLGLALYPGQRVRSSSGLHGFSGCTAQQQQCATITARTVVGPTGQNRGKVQPAARHRPCCIRWHQPRRARCSRSEVLMQSAASNQSPAAVAACERNAGMGLAGYFAGCTQVRHTSRMQHGAATAGSYQAETEQCTNRADHPEPFMFRANQGSPCLRCLVTCTARRSSNRSSGGSFRRKAKRYLRAAVCARRHRRHQQQPATEVAEPAHIHSIAL